jgi:transposase
MTRRHKSPLRALTEEERMSLEHVSRATSVPAVQVERARILLAVASGQSYTQAAAGIGRKSGDAVSHLVERFNIEGLTALTPRYGGGYQIQYGYAQQERILGEVRRVPDRASDGTATWSLKTLQRALRRASDGLPTVSTATILRVLHEAGFSYQRDGSWCETGTVVRKRKAGAVTVKDPQTEAKKKAD